jgi:spermidine synthase
MYFVFALNIFLSSYLIFLIQPMFTKIILPYLGGTSAVWNTSMIFYQTVLLLGYLYAHLCSRFLSKNKFIVLHIVIAIISILFLPLVLRVNNSFDQFLYPSYWLINSLIISVGLIFFILSGNAPINQYLFSYFTKHSKDTYSLYSISNFGNLVALAMYPLIFEIFWGLDIQSKIFSYSYIFFVISLSICSYFAWFRKESFKETTRISLESINIKQIYLWLCLSFIPSSLLMGVTSYLTNSFGNESIMWILPLGLYLLSFVLAYSKKQPFFKISQKLMPFAIIFLLSLMLYNLKDQREFYLLHIIGFFIISLVLNSILAKAAPDDSNLTKYFLITSFGGVLGGAFNSFLAPYIFNDFIEYPIILTIAIFCHPEIFKYLNIRLTAILTTLFIILFLLFSKTHFTLVGKDLLIMKFTLISIIIIILMIRRFKVQYSFFLYSAFVLLVINIFIQSLVVNPNILFQERNFFGVTKVIRNTLGHAQLVQHNKQPDEGLQFEYEILQQLTKLNNKNNGLSVAVIGLGTGKIACSLRLEKHVDFVELNESIKTIAQNDRLFSYLKNCAKSYEIEVGDGRARLSNVESSTYQMIVIDTVVHNLIYPHLFTQEALKIYLDKLMRDGLLVFHFTKTDKKNYQEVVANSATANNAEVFTIDSKFGGWIVVTNSKNYERKMLEEGWSRVPGNISKVWTDNFSGR